MEQKEFPSSWPIFLPSSWPNFGCRGGCCKFNVGLTRLYQKLHNPSQNIKVHKVLFKITNKFQYSHTQLGLPIVPEFKRFRIRMPFLSSSGSLSRGRFLLNHIHLVLSYAFQVINAIVPRGLVTPFPKSNVFFWNHPSTKEQGQGEGCWRSWTWEEKRGRVPFAASVETHIITGRCSQLCLPCAPCAPKLPGSGGKFARESKTSDHFKNGR